MKLVWSAFALADRYGIFTHIEADNPRAAIAVDERINVAARRLISRFEREGAFSAKLLGSVGERPSCGRLKKISRVGKGGSGAPQLLPLQVEG